MHKVNDINEIMRIGSDSYFRAHGSYPDTYAIHPSNLPDVRKPDYCVMDIIGDPTVRKSAVRMSENYVRKGASLVKRS